MAEGRGLTQDYVKTIAEGRVWVGTAALGLGLVDHLGNLDRTIAVMAETTGLDVKDVVRYPKSEENIWEKIIRQSGGLDGLKAAGYDAETLRYVNIVRRLRTDNPIQARIEPAIFK